MQQPLDPAATAPTRVQRSQPSDPTTFSGPVTGTSHCAICGETTVHLHLKASSDRIPKVYRITEEEHATCWDLWKCQTCGLIFSDWRLTDEELAELYKRMQDELYDREDECRRLTFRGGLSLLADHHNHSQNDPPAKPKSTDSQPPRGRLLDIGCATGIFLEEARKQGWQVSGVDLSHWAVQQARQRELTVHEGDVYSLPDNGPYDIVTMLDYNEHDAAPGSLVAQCAKLLHQGGLLYITSPDIGGFTAKLLRSRWWGINALHLYYFSRKCLTELLERQGFEVVITRAYRRTFTLGYWVSRLEHFHPFLGRSGAFLFRILGLANIPIPINLYDMMEVIARKR